MDEQPFLFGASDSPWIEVRDANHTGGQIFSRHYSKYHYRDGRKPVHFVGPGFKMVLLTEDARALFVWRKFRSMSNEPGINCAVFRNEGDAKASDLIRDADRIAWDKWPQDDRHYTYVDPRKVQRSRTPGRCFLKAGWKYVLDESGKPKLTKARKLLILEIFRNSSTG